MPKRKITETQRLRNNLKRQIANMEKRGYIIPEDIKVKASTGKYQTLKSLASQRYKKVYSQASAEYEGKTYTGTQFRTIERKTHKLKQPKQSSTIVDFSDLAGSFDPETGEIFEEAEDFYKRTGYQQGGTLTSEESSSVIIDNVVEDFLNKLEQDVPEYYVDNSGHRRYLRKERRDEIIRAKETLKEYVDEELRSGRYQQLAKRLQEHAGEVGDLTDKLFSYDETAIGIAQTRLASIIKGHAMSMQEMSQLDASLSMSYGYNEPS